MTREVALTILLALAGCTSIPPPEPMTTERDAQWVRDLDASVMEVETKTLDEHAGSPGSRIILRQTLECQRRVYIGKARAAAGLVEQFEVSRSEALALIQADPQWLIAEQGCRE